MQSHVGNVMKYLVKALVLTMSLASISLVNASDSGQEIELEQGKMQVLEISTSMMNEFVTPFKDPMILTKEEDQKFITKSGNIFYVRVPNDKEFIHVMLRDKGTSGASLALMLLPKEDIPGQHYMLNTHGGNKQGAIASTDESSYGQMPYTSMLKELARDAVKDVLNDGYMKDDEWTDNDFEKGNLYAKSMTLWTGAKLVIEKYSVVNLGHELMLSEESFYEKGVKAVAIHPKHKVKKSESTELYIIRERSGGE